MENNELNKLEDKITKQLARVRKHAPFDNPENYIIFLEALLRSMHENQIESKNTDQERLKEHQRLLIKIKTLTEVIAKFHQESDATRELLFKKDHTSLFQGSTKHYSQKGIYLWSGT